MCVLITGDPARVHPRRVDDVTALPSFPFRDMLHDRLGARRRDQRFLDAAWADPLTGVVVVRGTDLAASPDGSTLSWISPADAPPGERLLLGAADGVVRFALLAAHDPTESLEELDEVEVSAGPVAPSVTSDFSPLRRLAQGLSALDASFAVHAAALAGWHLRHPRCSVCGELTESVCAGESRRCPSCTAQHFPRTDPAVIMTVLDDTGRCLLGHNSARPDGWFSTLAGFVEPGESPEQSVVREVHEEVGVCVDRVTYLGSQPWPFPSSLMLGFEAHASSTAVEVDGEEITAARWFTHDELRQAVTSGEVGLPTTVSIAGALITHWYGEDLPPNVRQL